MPILHSIDRKNRDLCMIDKKIKAGFSRNYRASIGRIKSQSRQVALIGDQREARKAIETYETEIAAAKVVMVAFAAKKK